MKRHYLVIGLLLFHFLLIVSLYAQVSHGNCKYDYQLRTNLSADFESVEFPPASWQTTGWVRAASGGFPITGTASAMHRATGNTNGKRLITPQVRVETGSSLSFKAKRAVNNYGEQLLIKRSVNGTNWTLLQTITLTNPATLYNIDLSVLPVGDYYLCFETYSANVDTYTKAYIIDDVSGPILTSSIHSGSIHGYIKQIYTETPIVGASVTIDSINTISSALGYYRMDNINGGEYQLRCSATGYNGTRKQVTVIENDTLTCDIFLIPFDAIPDIPQIISFNYNSQGLSISWNACLNTQIYKVYYSATPFSAFVPIAQTTSTSIFFTLGELNALGVNPIKAFFKVTADSSLD